MNVIKIPLRSPSLYPICERHLGSVRRKWLDHEIILSERPLRRTRSEYEYIETNSVANERA